MHTGNLSGVLRLRLPEWSLVIIDTVGLRCFTELIVCYMRMVSQLN